MIDLLLLKQRQITISLLNSVMEKYQKTK